MAYVIEDNAISSWSTRKKHMIFTASYLYKIHLWSFHRTSHLPLLRQDSLPSKRTLEYLILLKLYAILVRCHLLLFYQIPAMKIQNVEIYFKPDTLQLNF